MRKSKAEKQMEAAVNAAYYRTFNRVPVNMLDIPEIYKAIEHEIKKASTPSSLADALQVIRNTYAK